VALNVDYTSRLRRIGLALGNDSFMCTELRVMSANTSIFGRFLNMGVSSAGLLVLVNKN
jgi:hypothetical protein